MSKAKTDTPEITLYLCGGTALNIGALLKENSHTDALKNAKFVGLDSSGNNLPGDLFPVERMRSADGSDEARGSGKVKRTNYDQAKDFVHQVMVKHKPTPFNVIVQNTAGGTGSMLGPVVMRALNEHDTVFVVVSISDFTTQVEMENAVGTLRSWANQTSRNQLNRVIPLIHEENLPNVTRGEVNKKVVDQINYLSLFLTEKNEEMDYQDIKNLLNYSAYYGVPAALSQIRFYNKDAALKFEGKAPVAVASLFADRDSVIPRFEGSVVRSTGVFGPGVQRPSNSEEFHMVLDHGQFVEALERRMETLEERKVASSTTFVQQKDLSKGAADNGDII